MAFALGQLQTLASMSTRSLGNRRRIGVVQNLANPVIEIRSVTVGVYAAAIAFCDNEHPDSEHAARFSLQHAIAVAILRGEPKATDFLQEAYDDPEISSLRLRIKIVEVPELTRAFPHRMSAKILFTLNNGKELSHECVHAPGDPENSMSQSEIERKFHTNMTDAGCAPSIASRLTGIFDTLLDAPSLKELNQVFNLTIEPAVNEEEEK